MFRTVATAAIILLTATAAQADSSRITVAFGDLNLSRPQDAKILADRLQTAAKQVCLDVVHTDDPTAPVGTGRQRAIQECMTSAINIAVAHIEGRLDTIVRSNVASNGHEALTAELVNAQN